MGDTSEKLSQALTLIELLTTALDQRWKGEGNAALALTLMTDANKFVAETRDTTKRLLENFHARADGLGYRLVPKAETNLAVVVIRLPENSSIRSLQGRFKEHSTGLVFVDDIQIVDGPKRV